MFICIFWHKARWFFRLLPAYVYSPVPRGEDGEKEEKAKDEKGRQKLRLIHTHRYGEPEAPESVFWKKIIAYQQKLLVSPLGFTLL